MKVVIPILGILLQFYILLKGQILQFSHLFPIAINAFSIFSLYYKELQEGKREFIAIIVLNINIHVIENSFVQKDIWKYILIIIEFS